MTTDHQLEECEIDILTDLYSDMLAKGERSHGLKKSDFRDFIHLQNLDYHQTKIILENSDIIEKTSKVLDFIDNHDFESIDLHMSKCSLEDINKAASEILKEARGLRGGGESVPEHTESLSFFPAVMALRNSNNAEELNNHFGNNGEIHSSFDVISESDGVYLFRSKYDPDAVDFSRDVVEKFSCAQYTEEHSFEDQLGLWDIRLDLSGCFENDFEGDL
ncbi:MAG: hypothetical protein RLN62_02230 [Rickettsiales bacterium]